MHTQIYTHAACDMHTYTSIHIHKHTQRYGGMIINVTCGEYAHTKSIDMAYIHDQVEAADTQGLIKVTIESGTNIRMPGSAEAPDPFARVYIDDQTFQTRTRKGTPSPQWQQTFALRAMNPPKKIVIEVFHEDPSRPGGGVSIGKANVPLSGRAHIYIYISVCIYIYVYVCR